MKINNLKNNTKDLQLGDTFICTTNEKLDRHYLISEALKQGANIIVDNKHNIKKVKNTNQFFYNFFSKKYNYPQKKLKIIGITGTDGKTTTATIIKDLLSNFKTCAYLGTNGFNINNLNIKTSNTTSSIDKNLYFFNKCLNENCKYIIMEVSSEGLLYNRCYKIKFNGTLLTNITGDHLNSHKTMENYIETKQKLFKKVKHNGFVILNKDDKCYKKIKENIRHKIITYGSTKDCNYYFKNIIYSDIGTTFDLMYKNNIYHIKSPLLGKFNVYNLVLSIACLKQLNFKIDNIIKYIPNLKQVSGRLEFLNITDKFKIVLDYAHTKNATYEVLNLLKNIKHNHIITVVGCAGGREKEKRRAIGKIVTDNSDLVIFTMDDPRFENVLDIINDMEQDIKKSNYKIITNRKKAIIKALSIAKKDDIIVILGKGNDNYMAIMDKYIPYSDKDVINNYFKKSL